MCTVKSTLLALAIVAGACFNVYAQKEEKISEIGDPIKKEIANDWMINFKAKNPNAIYAYTYGKKMLRELFASPEAQGVYIYNGLDGNGEVHLIFKAANTDGNPIGLAYNNGLPCPPRCPEVDNIASIGRKIEEGLAQQMIENFQRNADGRVQAHLYGRDVFEMLLSKKDIEGIYFAYGSDNNGQEHLILLGINKEGQLDWDPPVNNGLPCPPYCESGYPVISMAQKN